MIFYRFRIAVKKELKLLLHDRAGMALMFIMPILLVYVITIIQDSAFKIVNENKISILVVNNDSGNEGERLIDLMNEAKIFDLYTMKGLEEGKISQTLIDKNYLSALLIPVDFSSSLIQKSDLLSTTMLGELGMETDNSIPELRMPDMNFYHDPALQENYCASIVNVVNSLIKTMEGEILIRQICKSLDVQAVEEDLNMIISQNNLALTRIPATLTGEILLPNSTQHNVPAWTIFAMFFMVVSLGNNIVRERVNGAFIRLQTMPTSLTLVLGAKLFVYFFAAVFQVALIFTLAKLTFPSIGLPPLTLPENHFSLVVVVAFCSLSAVSYATLVGMFAKTPEQANGFGAVSIVILASIGGIWVPSFVMPDYLQTLSYFSPLYWCLEGFYTLFLRGGDLNFLTPILLGLTAFISVCFTAVYFRLKAEKMI